MPCDIRQLNGFLYQNNKYEHPAIYCYHDGWMKNRYEESTLDIRRASESTFLLPPNACFLLLDNEFIIHHSDEVITNIGASICFGKSVVDGPTISVDVGFEVSVNIRMDLGSFFMKVVVWYENKSLMSRL